MAGSDARFGWREWLVLAGFLASLLALGVFAGRAIRAASSLRHEEPLRAWMTIPYIAHAYHVPAADLYQALGVTPLPHDRRPLAAIAREQHRPVDEVIVETQHAIRAARSGAPTPPRNPMESVP